MSKWKKVKIKDIASLDNGINFSKSAYAPGVKIIGVSDFKNRFSPDFSTLQEVKEEIVKRGDYLQFGDILFVRSNGNRDLVGRCMLIDKNIKSTFSGFCIRLRINDLNSYNPYFFTYHFKTSLFRKSIAGSAIGANIQNLSQNRLGDYELKLPEYFIQCRIAEILSRYDSLIENYQKQIKLLEESAQLLYKEWFVDLRFPGHENTKIVNGVPEEWKKKCLGELACFKRGKTITKKEIIEGNIPVVAGGIEPAYYCNKSNTGNRVVTISASGANAGYTRMYFEKIWASDCSFIDTSITDFLHFVYCFLIANKTAIDNLQKGAAQPHVYPKDINALELCCPHRDILNCFEAKISYYFDLISSLQNQIHKLTEARDRLLPKLMSGEIEV